MFTPTAVLDTTQVLQRPGDCGAASGSLTLLVVYLLLAVGVRLVTRARVR